MKLLLLYRYLKLFNAEKMIVGFHGMGLNVEVGKFWTFIMYIYCIHCSWNDRKFVSSSCVSQYWNTLYWTWCIFVDVNWSSLLFTQKDKGSLLLFHSWKNYSTSLRNFIMNDSSKDILFFSAYVAKCIETTSSSEGRYSVKLKFFILQHLSATEIHKKIS